MAALSPPGKPPAKTVGDPLDSPPAAGQDTSWLSQTIADAKAKLAQARAWASGNVDALKAKARVALDSIVDWMRRAEATAIIASQGPLGSPSPAQIVSLAKGVEQDAQGVLSTLQTYSTPLLVLALVLLWKWKMR